MYYLRTKAATNAIQFTVDKTKLQQVEKANAEKGDAEEEGVTAADVSSLNKLEKRAFYHDITNDPI